MRPMITVDRTRLRFSDGVQRLDLAVEWSGVATTEDFPCDFEIYAGDLRFWTEPAGEPIGDARREELLDEITEYYSKAPAADIVGKDGELPGGNRSIDSPCYRFLAIPVASPIKGSRDRTKYFVLDATGSTEWTSPKLRIERAREKIGVIWLTRT